MPGARPTWPSSARPLTRRSATGPARVSGRAPSARRRYTQGGYSLQLDIEPFEHPRRGRRRRRQRRARRRSSAATRWSFARCSRSRAPAPYRSSSAATTRSPGRRRARSPQARHPRSDRHRPFRCPRRYRQRRLGRARRPRHADAPADRVGRGRRQQLRAGRPARLLAAAGGLRLDAASTACAGT